MKLKARNLILAAAFLLAVSCQIPVFAEDTGSDITQSAAGKIQNGSFETFGDSRFPKTSSSKYTQVIPQDTDYWKTTAYEKKMELLRENTGVYIKGVKLTPSGWRNRRRAQCRRREQPLSGCRYRAIEHI